MQEADCLQELCQVLPGVGGQVREEVSDPVDLADE